jgi:hypothetical protein
MLFIWNICYNTSWLTGLLTWRCILIEDYNIKFEKYVGKIFYRIIRKHKISDINTVIEFAPGFRFKVAYALKKLKFKGTLYVIDTNEKVLDFVKNKYQEILPNANIICLDKNLIDSIDLLPNNVDLFLSNHCIDDVLISKCLKEEEAKSVFNNEEGAKQLLINTWNRINDTQELIEYKKSIRDEFKMFFENIKFRFIVLSHYKSIYYSNQNNYIEESTRDIFLSLKEKIYTDNTIIDKAMNFNQKEFFIPLESIEHNLKNNIQNSNNWIAGVYNK